MTRTSPTQSAYAPARSVTPARSGLLQRKCACCGTPGQSGECEEGRKKRLQRKTRNSELGTQNNSFVPPVVHEVLRSPGQPLDPATRAFMEPRFGHDFSRVRVHTDAKAAESARAVDALAYTLGRDVVFGAGQYAPGSPTGQRLMAHELAHTLQQQDTTGILRRPEQFEVTQPTDTTETEAQSVADCVLNGRWPGAVSHVRPLIAREMVHEISDAGAKAPVGTAAPPTPIKTVKVWLNAFIPQTVPGKTIPAPAAHTGKSMLNGPIFSECYLSDNRSFDANIGAPSRMHSEIEIDVSGPKETFHWHYCYETYEINCKTAAAVCTKNGRTSDMKFKSLRGSSSSTIQIDLEGASNNPCYSGSPDIDYEGTFAIDVGKRTVEFDGKIDDFPAFEGYATANSGAGVMLFNTMPLPGKDPWNLPGKAARVQTGKASI